MHYVDEAIKVKDNNALISMVSSLQLAGYMYLSLLRINECFPHNWCELKNAVSGRLNLNPCHPLYSHSLV